MSIDSIQGVPYGMPILVSMALVGFLLLKRTVDHAMETLDRIPSKEWFDEIREAIKKIPDPERLREHYTQGHNHTNTLSLQAVKLAELERRIIAIEERA